MPRIRSPMAPIQTQGNRLICVCVLLSLLHTEQVRPSTPPQHHHFGGALVLFCDCKWKSIVKYHCSQEVAFFAGPNKTEHGPGPSIWVAEVDFGNQRASKRRFRQALVITEAAPRGPGVRVGSGRGFFGTGRRVLYLSLNLGFVKKNP